MDGENLRAKSKEDNISAGTEQTRAGGPQHPTNAKKNKTANSLTLLFVSSVQSLFPDL